MDNTNPQVPELPAEFGTLVNNLPDDDEAQIFERKIKLLTEERVNLCLTRELYGKLEQKASFMNLSIEQHCIAVLADSVDVQIGKPTISRPSKVSGTSTNVVTGPSFATNADYRQ